MVEKMEKKFTVCLFFILLCFSAFTLYAQTGVGKLSGKVVDADTREPLIGANVILVNSEAGAATNIDGEYFILNITPGTYSVKFSYVGYAPKTVQEVRVVAGITYELNVELSTDFTLPEIVVQDKKFFEEKATNTVKVVDADQISRLPVRGIAQIAALQSGVVMQEGSGGVAGNASINIRGGRSSEVLYIVDGIPQNNLYTRGNVTQVSNDAIDQISFQVGGYEAKYGQAQSGIINVTTKSGNPYYNLSADIISSNFTDDYGYNLYSGTLSGPIIPGLNNNTIFLSAERGWFKDGDPTAIPVEFYYLENGEYVKHSSPTLPNNAAEVWRMSGRTNHRFGSFTANLGAIYNKRTANVYSQRAAKNSAQFFDQFYQENLSLSSRISQTLSASTFWNVTLGYRTFNYKRYNPYFEDNLYAYGDSSVYANQFGATLLANGQRTKSTDASGVMRPYGYATNLYQRRENSAATLDLDLTSQIDNHLLEFGAGISSTIVRGYGIYAYQIAGQADSLSTDQKYYNLSPFVYGYDLSGQNKVGTNYSDPTGEGALPRPDKLQSARNPFIGYAFLQDRFELEDLVINLGLRADYFDIKSYEFVNPDLPFAGGSNPIGFDNADFKVRDPEILFSPRIGIGFPVTKATVFHAQYGRFIQLPELNDVYSGPFSYNDYLSFEPQDVNNPALDKEITTQYEVGFRQLLGSSAALNITLFYKNIEGLVNTQNSKFQRTINGEILNAIRRTNADFGTTKGLAFSLDVARLDYIGMSAQYTYSVAEGTGSSTSSSQTAVFRNNDNLPPKVIAPLDFDQTHTATINLDIYVPKGKAGYLEMLNANFLFSFNSGTPYTPLDKYNIIGDNGIGSSTTGYINSRYGPSNFRVDMKLEKRFEVGGLSFAPYLWVENLFDVDNVVAVWQSTGDAFTTGYLNTDEGKAVSQNNGPGFAYDYKSLEKTPGNFGIPRTIKLGFKFMLSGANY